MKRFSYLYENLYDIKNIEAAFNEVCRNTHNKRKVEFFKEYKCIYISRIYNVLKQEKYSVGPYNSFTIYEPKKRQIISQNMYDKVVNHLVSREILYPSLFPCLLDFNVASRKNMGTSYAVNLYLKYRRYFSIRYKTYYILKCDISKFFDSINHDILKEKLKRRIKDKKSLKIVFDIIDSHSPGLGIGNMTSQALAIFYLNDMDHFIKEVLKIKCVIRYQDDFLLFHESKDYLKFCLKELECFLNKEDLKLNKKTRIFKNTDNFIFIGVDKYGHYSHYRNVRRRLKKRTFLYSCGQISLNSLVSSRLSYKNLCRNKLKF